MSKTLVCLSETLSFYAQEICQDKSFSYTVDDDAILKSKMEVKGDLLDKVLPQDENTCLQQPHTCIDQKVLKRSLSRKREAPNILMESVKRRENMQSIDHISNVPFDSNNCNIMTSPQMNTYSELCNQQLIKSISPVDMSYSTDSGIEDSSKSNSPSHSFDNVSIDEQQVSLDRMEIGDSKKDYVANESEKCGSEGSLSPESDAIDLDGLNLEEASHSPVIPKSPIIQSLFKNVSPMLYFSTPDEIVEPLDADTLSLMKWKQSTITPTVLRETVLKCGFHIVDIDTKEDWIGTWGKSQKSNTYRKIKCFQKINHYPGSFHLGRKDKLWNNIRKMQEKHGKKIYGFFPDTYVLPADIKLLKKVWDEESNLCWIKKPCASARGAGVKIIHKWCQVPKKNPVVVQRYICDPYLINGSKFDLRLYVLVPSFNPLRIYLYPDGLVRFASEKYSLSDMSFSNRFVHLTNYSVNKKSSTYTSNDDETICQGHKWSLKSFWKYMSDSGIDVDKIKANITDLIIKTVIGCEGEICRVMKIHARCSYNCFEMFGFDIMLDKNLQPWLLEVNISPSLHTSSALDFSVKRPLVKDMLNIAGYELPQKSPSGSVYLPSNGSRHQPISRLLLNKEKIQAMVGSESTGNKNSVLENLTLDDISVLMETEDEHNRCGNFVRVFPSKTSNKYFKYFNRPGYYNVLLDAWEQTFDKNEGIKKIQDLFDKIKNEEQNGTDSVCEPEENNTVART